MSKIATKTEQKNFYEANKETIKFVLRMVILVAGPQLLAWAAARPGSLWANIASAVLPVVDKWIHENDNLESKGIVPF